MVVNLINRRTFERPDESRRRALRLLALGSLFAGRAGAYADELVRTPRMTEGPFFPDRLPLDIDNDLLVITDAIEPTGTTVAAGVPTCGPVAPSMLPVQVDNLHPQGETSAMGKSPA